MRDAVVAVLCKNERFLMIKRAEGVMAPGYWVPPSGRVEPGESPQEALEREMMEELELEVRAVRKVWDCPTEDGSMQLDWWEVQADGEIGTPDVSEIAEVRWCSVPEIESLSPTFDEDVRFFTEIWPALER